MEVSRRLKPDVQIRYDTIRYIYVRLKADAMTNLIQLTAQKRKIRKMSNQKPSSREEATRAIVHEGSPEGRSETPGGRICEIGKF